VTVTATTERPAALGRPPGAWFAVACPRCGAAAFTYCRLLHGTLPSGRKGTHHPHRTRLIASGQHVAPDTARVERLAEVAHAAWLRWYERQGITSRIGPFGEEFMVPWESLSEQGKDLDRTVVAAIMLG
jgi:hypothetical protein